MSWWFRVLTDLQKDLESSPKTYMATHNSNSHSKESGTLTLTPMYKKNKQKFKKSLG